MRTFICLLILLGLTLCISAARQKNPVATEHKDAAPRFKDPRSVRETDDENEEPAKDETEKEQLAEEDLDEEDRDEKQSDGGAFEDPEADGDSEIAESQDTSEEKDPFFIFWSRRRYYRRRYYRRRSYRRRYYRRRSYRRRSYRRRYYRRRYG